jgi:hypothetical protein
LARSYLEKTLHKKGLVEWLKVSALSSNPSTKKKRTSSRNLCQSLGVVLMFSYKEVSAYIKTGRIILTQNNRALMSYLVSIDPRFDSDHPGPRKAQYFRRTGSGNGELCGGSGDKRRRLSGYHQVHANSTSLLFGNSYW